MTLTEIFQSGFRYARKVFWNGPVRLELSQCPVSPDYAMSPFATLLDDGSLSRSAGGTPYNVANDISDEWLPVRIDPTA